MHSDSNLSVSRELPAQAVWMRRLARSLVRDDATADDLAQEASLRALERPADARCERSWAAGVVRNLARRAWRDAGIRRRHERAGARDEALPATDEVVGRLEVQRNLAEELGGLEEPFRTTVVRRYFDGWSAARIARASGVPAATVRWRLQEALRRLRAQLNRRDRRAGGDGTSWRLALLPFAGPLPVSPSGSPGQAARRFFESASGPGLSTGLLTMKLSTSAVTGTVLLVAFGLGALWYTATTVPSGGEHVAGAGFAAEPVSELDAETASLRAPDTEPADARSVHAAPAAPPIGDEAPVETTAVHGRCLDRQLTPIRHARVFEVGADPLNGPEAQSDEAGSFELVYADAQARSTHLCIKADGYGTRFVPVQLERGRITQVGEILLQPGGTVQGVVWESTGAPREGALVSISGAPLWGDLDAARRLGPRGGGPMLTAASDSLGRFRIEGVPAEMVRVWASAPDRLHAVTEPLSVPAHGTTPELELVLEPLGRDDRIAGIVRSPDGVPVARTKIGYQREAGLAQQGGSITADADGRFVLLTMRGSTYDLTFSDPEGRWLDVRLDDLAPGQTGLDVRFAEKRWIEVTVRSGSADIGSFALEALRADDGERATSGESVSPGLGRIAVPEQPFEVRVGAHGYQLATQGPFDPDWAPSTLTFDLTPEPALRGVVTAYGEPVPGAVVRAHELRSDLHINHRGYTSFVLPQAVAETRTDQHGVFVLSVRAVGSFVLRAEARGYAAGEFGAVELAGGAGRNGLEIRLTRGGAIEGHVLMPSGRDPAGVIVAINRGDSYARTVRSDAEGHFRFEDLTPGAWEVSHGELEIVPGVGATGISSRSSASELAFNCDVVDGETTVQDLDLSSWRPCVVEGTLLVNGEPADAWELTAWPAGSQVVVGHVPSTAVDARGTYTFEMRAAGPVRLVLQAPLELGGAGNIGLPVELAPGLNTWSHDLRMGSLEGTASSDVVEGTLFYRAAPDSEHGLTCILPVIPDETGRFFIPAVPAGKGSIQRLDSETGSAWSLVTELEVAAGATRFVELP